MDEHDGVAELVEEDDGQVEGQEHGESDPEAPVGEVELP